MILNNNNNNNNNNTCNNAFKKLLLLAFLDSLVNLEMVNIHDKLTKPEDGNIPPLSNALKRTGGKIW